MKVLVTGHHGYIGSVLGPLAMHAGHEVVGLDTYYYRGCDFADHSPRPFADVVDVRDVSGSALAGFDAVVHLAALSNDPVGDLNAEWTYDINRDATIALARAAREAGVTRFVFASSCSMYGAGDDDDLVDEDAALRPLTAYAESKVRAEEALLALADGAFAPVSMRNATAYGVSPRLRLDIVLNNLTAWAHTTGKIRLMSDGTAWRPLVHIEDISRAALALLDGPVGAIAGRAFNIGPAGENYQIRELANVVRECVPRCEIEVAEGASTDSRSYRVDFSRFAAAFPACRLSWTASAGAEELITAYERVGLSLETFQGRRFIRLGQIQHLHESGLLDESLRWSSRDS